MLTFIMSAVLILLIAWWLDFRAGRNNKPDWKHRSVYGLTVLAGFLLSGWFIMYPHTTSPINFLQTAVQPLNGWLGI